jgi:hypothetical protein
VETVKKMEAPTTMRELQILFGLVNFYRRFLPAIAHNLLPSPVSSGAASLLLKRSTGAREKRRTSRRLKQLYDRLRGWHIPVQRPTWPFMQMPLLII